MMMKFNPLKRIFTQIYLSRHLAKWVMLLTKFDLNFISKEAIKGQALIDQLANAPSPLTLPNNDSFPNDNVLIIEYDTWDLCFEISSCRKIFDTRATIVFLKGEPIPLSHRLKFL
jgi:hypothetical protein